MVGNGRSPPSLRPALQQMPKRVRARPRVGEEQAERESCRQALRRFARSLSSRAHRSQTRVDSSTPTTRRKRTYDNTCPAEAEPREGVADGAELVRFLRCRSRSEPVSSLKLLSGGERGKEHKRGRHRAAFPLRFATVNLARWSAKPTTFRSALSLDAALITCLGSPLVALLLGLLLRSFAPRRSPSSRTAIGALPRPRALAHVGPRRTPLKALALVAHRGRKQRGNRFRNHSSNDFRSDSGHSPCEGARHAAVDAAVRARVRVRYDAAARSRHEVTPLRMSRACGRGE